MSNKEGIKKFALVSVVLIALLLALSSCISNNQITDQITGFAVLDENATNETITETITPTQEEPVINTTTTAATEESNETGQDKKEKDKKPEESAASIEAKEKPEKKANVPPVWKSDVNEFILIGPTQIDLSTYFIDENNDSLAYLFTTPDGINVDVDASIVTLTPLKANFNTTITFTATDGEKATTKDVALIVPQKSIEIALEYETGSIYDVDNNGYESATGVIDFTVANSLFSWDGDESKLCTRWKTYSIDTGDETTICNGNEKCCSFIGLAPTRTAWNEPFFSIYGQYGATLSNIVSAQVLYVDYSVDISEPFAEIYYSEWQNKTANYYFESIGFENVCVETCTLTNFTDTTYKLIFEIDNAVLTLDSLTYSVAEEISNVLVDLNVENSDGLESGIYQLYKDDALVQVTDGLVQPDYYDVEIIPTENIIDKLAIESANITKPLSANIGIDNVTREIGIEDVDVKKRYAVNLEELEFEKATLTATATANSLFKCRQWDYEREICFGTWEKIKDLTAGQQYDVILTKDDPGFIEGDSNITIAPINITNITINMTITNITRLELIQNIPNLTIAVNTNSTIDLSDYFSNVDDATTFTYYQQDDIAILFDKNMATIVPDTGFIGAVYTFITASQNDNLAISNLFSITIANVTTNISANITPNLIFKKKDFKLDEDIEVDFEYLTKGELVKENKWEDEYEVYEEETEKTEDELKLLRKKIEDEEKLLTIGEKAIKKQIKKWQKATESVEASVFDSSGNLRDIDIEIEELREGKFDIRIVKPRSFKAGKYTLKLDLTKDGITYSQSQDFTWGVLAINLNKSTYLQNDDAFISIGVLDNEGKIVCNADVIVSIISPSNQKTTLDTADGSIKISPECEVLGITELPDYYTTYSVDGIGVYAINLTAITQNGERTVTDSFNVTSFVNFDVARSAQTRIYPKVPYTMDISIIANDNYNGAINEYVPSSFRITPQDGMTVTTNGDTSTLSWNVNLNSGDKINLNYEYDAPDISPEFYLLGPLNIGSFNEARQWQLANDQAANFNYTYPDAGAPGMNLVVTIVGTGFAVGDTITTNSSGNITVGPILIYNASGNDQSSVTNGTLATAFYIHPNATAQDVRVDINGVALPNPFKIISLTGANKDDGNFSGFTSGKYLLGDGINGTRTSRGTIVLDALIIPSGVTVIINTTDLDSGLPGDQGYLPVTIVVDGPVTISGTLNVSGERGFAASGEFGGVGGKGGPGGGGGGGGASDLPTPAIGLSGGSGYTGGGGSGCDRNCIPGPGGNGTGSLGGQSPGSNAGTGGSGGNSTSRIAQGGGGGVTTTADGGGGGGGTGYVFGSNAQGGLAGAQGLGGSGGGGGGRSGASNSGGNGGFGTAGGNGALAGSGGGITGNAQLVPLAGGSGGGGGGVTATGGGGGGGGGGAILIIAKDNITITATGRILAIGGAGGAGAGLGGGGSGGAIVLQSNNVSILGELNATGNDTVRTPTGLGRIRIDGLDNPAAQAIIGRAGSNFTGPAIKNITSSSIGGTGNKSTDIVVFVTNKTNGVNATFKGTTDSNGKFDIAVTWFEGNNYVAVMQNSTTVQYSILSSAAVTTYAFVPPPDNTPPTVNITNINNSNSVRIKDILNISAYMTGSPTLVNFTFNLTGNTNKFNFSYAVSGTTVGTSQNITVNVTRGSIINATVVACDSSSNCAINSTLVTIADFAPFNMSIGINDTSIQQGDSVNITGNATDYDIIQYAWIEYNRTGSSNKINYTFFKGAVTATFWQNFTIDFVAGNVFNFSTYINDSSGLTNYLNSTLVSIIDGVFPVVNATFNSSSIIVTDTINYTANITDETQLKFANFTVNLTTGKVYANYTISGTSIQLSNTTSLRESCSAPETCVLNFTWYATDTSSNVRQNDTLLTVQDRKSPRINASPDDSSPGFDQIINVTANVSDLGGLSFCQFIDNMSMSNSQKTILNVSLTGTSDQCSQNYTISGRAGSVFNFTVIVNDTSTAVAGGNNNQSINIITVGTKSKLSACRNLAQVNVSYTLAKNVNSTATCINILANNITLDCKGFMINYSQSAVGYGVNISSQNFTTIRSCDIAQANIASVNSDSHGIYIYRNASNNVVYNNSITTNGSNAYSVYLLEEAYNNSIYNNTLTTGGGSAQAITSDANIYSNSIFNNSINTFGTFAVGISLAKDVYNNSIYSNSIITIGFDSSAIVLSTPIGSIYRNSIYSNTMIARGNNAEGVDIAQNAYNNSFYDNNMAVTGSSYAFVVNQNVAYNSFYSNIITTNNVSSRGFYLSRNVYNNTFYDNNITIKNMTGSYGIYILYGVNNNTFYRNTISSLGAGIVINGSTPSFQLPESTRFNTFTNDTIVPCSSGCNDNYYDVILTANATDTTFLNVSFNKSRISFIAHNPYVPTEKNNLTVQWYITINVTNSTDNDPIPDSQVVINDSFATNLFNGTTDATGGIKTLIVTEFTINGSTNWSQMFTPNTYSCAGIDNINITCFAPFNISVNHTDYLPANVSLTLNRSLFLNISLTIRPTPPDNTPPVVNTTFNNTNPLPNDVINFTGNITDETGLLYVNITYNLSGIITKANYSVSSKTASIWNITEITVESGNVINFTMYATDTSNNVKQNSTILIVIDNISPIINGSLNKSITSIGIKEVLNVTFNLTDKTGLLFGNITWNITRGLNSSFSLSGGASQINNVTALPSTCAAGCVINVTGYATDTSNNIRQNSTVFTVIDNIAPIVNTTVNVTNAKVNDVINYTANITDETGLLFANLTYNISGILTKINYSISGTALQLSNFTILTCVETCVINFTWFATDTSNNVRQNDTLLVVADITPPIVNTSLNKTSPLVTDTINYTANITDGNGLLFANFTVNLTTGKVYANYTISGASIQLSNTTSLRESCSAPETCVLNFTWYATDVKNNVKQNSTLLSIADIITPVVNTTFNTTAPRNIDVINFTGNVSDLNGLITANWTINFSTGKVFMNYTLTGTSAQVSNTTNLMGIARGTVLNFTLLVTDGSNNVKQNDTVFTVTDALAPIVNTSLNISSPITDNVINFTANATDETGLLFINWTFNLSTGIVKLNYSVSGTAITISNSTQLCSEPCIVNFTAFATDTSNNVKQNSTLITVASSNAAPIIKLNNASTFSVDPVSGGASVILLSFNVTDAQGVSDINTTKIIVNLTLGTPGFSQFRFNISDTGAEFGTCYNHSQPGPGSEAARIIINCTIVMRYYDNASSNWVINVSVADLSGEVGRNDTLSFTYNTLSGLSLPVPFINFSSVNLGQQNVPSSPLYLNNTGNEDFDQINVSAAALIGTTTSSESIASTNFYANISNETAGVGQQLAATPVSLLEWTGLDNGRNTTLLHGHTGSSYALIKDKGNRTVHFWVDVPTGGLSSQLYNATWNITVINNP